MEWLLYLVVAFALLESFCLFVCGESYTGAFIDIYKESRKYIGYKALMLIYMFVVMIIVFPITMYMLLDMED